MVRRQTSFKLCILLFIMVLFWYLLFKFHGRSSEPTSLRIDLENYLFTTMDELKIVPIGLNSCEDRTNRTKIVSSFKKLLKNLVLQRSTSTELESQLLCHLPKNILNHPRLTSLVNRMRHMKQQCEDVIRHFGIQSTEIKLLQIKSYQMNICRNPKSASSALGVYTNSLFILNLLDLYASTLRELSTHHLIENVDILPEKDRKILMGNKLNLISVRHPFQRALSAYLNKVYHFSAYRKDLPELYAEMQTFSVMSPEEALAYALYNRTRQSVKLHKFTCQQGIKEFDGQPFKTSPSQLADGVPTFRGYALAVAVDLLNCRREIPCLNEKEKHYRTQTIKCAPCDKIYDIIIKAETLEEDMLFIEDLMNLPKAWNLHQKILANNDFELEKLATATSGSEGETYARGPLRANVSARDKTFAEYMSELSKEEKDLLYTAYYDDFNLYDYDPCEGL